MVDNKALAEKYDLQTDHFWKHSQSGKWIISHIGCMIIADKENVCFSDPEYIKTEPGLIVMFGKAKVFRGKNAKTETKEVWTHGEASTKNCVVPYPYAMAEKRLKDRLTLMIISAYGDVYSEIEADEFAAQQKVLVAESDK
jgi:hypothetical protein